MIAEFSAPIAIIAAGEVMLLICGEIDLSAGNVYAFSTWIFYFANHSWGLPIWLAVIVGLLSGSLVGVVNGVVTVFVGVPSFITTLGMIFLLNGLTLIMSGAFPVETPGGSTFFKFFGGGAYVTVYWALGVIVAMTILLNRTRWGLHTLATGGNLIGASESGVNVQRIKVGNFVLCSTLAALAGILESVRITSIQALQGGTPLMFYAVAAAVIGGTSLFGGSGTIIGAAIGVLVLAVLNLGFTLQGINAYTFDLVLGIAIIASMSFNVTLERIRQSRAARDLEMSELAVQPDDRTPRAEPDAIRVENIRKSFGVVTALEDVSLNLRPGEVLGLIGDNGAGKSTLIKILTGFHKPDSGRMFVHGEEVQLKSVTHARSLGIDTVFQDLALVPGLSVYHNMFLESRDHARGRPSALSQQPCDAEPVARVSGRHRRAHPVDGRGGGAHVRGTAPSNRDRSHDAFERDDHPARRAPCRDGRARGCADHRADNGAQEAGGRLDDRDSAQLRARLRNV